MEPQIHAALDLELPLTPEVQAAVAQARQDALTGSPGELLMQVEVRRADGRVEQHTLTGRVTGLA